EICAQELILERERKHLVEFSEAIESWYDNVYIPLAEAIRDRDLLHWFPDRTITDLYVWISENRAALEEELGWEIKSDIAVTDLIMERSAKSEPGSWRKARTATRYTDHLFNDVLVPLSGDAESWDSLEQAIIIAQHEEAKLHGLHIVDAKKKVTSEAALAVRAQFKQMCNEAGIDGKLVIEAGDITKKISERARMADLVVLKIVHPPMGGLATLKSPFRKVIQDSSRPVLGIPSKASRFQRALLAYDGSELAKEALFVATYLAELWKTELVVFTAPDSTRVTSDVQDHVRKYLDIHEVEAEYIISEHGTTDYFKQTVEEKNADLVLMGSHGGNMLQQVFIGSALDYMLRESNVPIFICR
ncbi:MAG TPA: universal stress protein, partial [Anaerolineales bacterium]|nr:universal stress protein [Anaerolineales bacterium]